MFMPIFKPQSRLLIASLCALSLSACSLFDDGFDDDTNAAEAEADTIAEWQETEDDNLIECALGGSEAFLRECLVELTERSWQSMFVIHHPDGGFRRFDVMNEGAGEDSEGGEPLTLETSDGADQALIEVTGEQMLVVVADDRYLFPADLTALTAE